VWSWLTHIVVALVLDSVSLKDLDSALGQFQALFDDGVPVSAGQLNCILSAAAERGDIHSMLFIVEEFKRLGLALDADSYSFVLETLGKHLYRADRVGEANETLIQDCLEKASGFLSMMEEHEVLPTPHIIREYVELLCQAGEFDTATEVVLEALESGDAVNHKTVYKVAMACADRHQFDAARNLANRLSKTLPELLKTIDKKEVEAATSRTIVELKLQ
jgi:hypothetical protein